jgi:hypothetical protein
MFYISRMIKTALTIINVCLTNHRYDKCISENINVMIIMVSKKQNSVKTIIPVVFHQPVITIIERNNSLLIKI